MAAPRITETTTAGTVMALTGVIQWAIATYAFGGNLPSELSLAIYVVVPALAGALVGFFVRKSAKQPVPAAEPAPAKP